MLQTSILAGITFIISLISAGVMVYSEVPHSLYATEKGLIQSVSPSPSNLFTEVFAVSGKTNAQ